MYCVLRSVHSWSGVNRPLSSHKLHVLTKVVRLLDRAAVAPLVFRISSKQPQITYSGFVSFSKTTLLVNHFYLLYTNCKHTKKIVSYVGFQNVRSGLIKKKSLCLSRHKRRLFLKIFVFPIRVLYIIRALFCK